MLDMSEDWARMDDEVSNTPMPTEYAGLYREILCKDCNTTCTAVFHIVGMKCRSCGSYNTTQNKGPLLRLQTEPDH
jgi:RING finger/CHY zinc finger protein 1